MTRVFLTGDKHCNFQSPDDYQKIKAFCEQFETTLNDYMIVLGDHGVHYDDGWSDYHAKKRLSKYPINFIMVRGNHDMRPNDGWKHIGINAGDGAVVGTFIEDPEFSNILYTTEYGWYQFAGRSCFVIGGAYSADKYYRLEQQSLGNKNWRWFPNEQLSEGERNIAGLQLLLKCNPKSIILSHTCPLRFGPSEMFLAMVDQDTVDKTMENWMDHLYQELMNDNRLPKTWYCGHWHTDKTDGIMRFMFHDILELEPVEADV